MRKTYEELALDTNQRVIRIETKLMRLGDELGHSLKDGNGLEVHEGVIVIPSLDTSLSTIINKASAAKMKGERGAVRVYRDGELVALVMV